MAEPLTRAEADATPADAHPTDASFGPAAQRLERALARLEAALGGTAAAAPPEPRVDPDAALVIALDGARRRQRRLAAAAAAASEALGEAAAEVRRTLEEDAERQGSLDLGSLDGGGPDEGGPDPDDGADVAEPSSTLKVDADGPPSEEEPAA